DGRRHGPVDHAGDQRPGRPPHRPPRPAGRRRGLAPDRRVGRGRRGSATGGGGAPQRPARPGGGGGDRAAPPGAAAAGAAPARPVVQTQGGWVELDKADVEAAAAALADRSKTKELSGAAILRHAVGLEGGIGGPVLVDGGGWAVDLVHGAAAGAARPLPAPEGFEGELRHYQAEARGWLGFLDRAGLGGCLAMDMGLGKTPTVLAHILEHKGEGPALVIAPPAVLGNWAAEAARFTPGLE